MAADQFNGGRQRGAGAVCVEGSAVQAQTPGDAERRVSGSLLRRLPPLAAEVEAAARTRHVLVSRRKHAREQPRRERVGPRADAVLGRAAQVLLLQGDPHRLGERPAQGEHSIVDADEHRPAERLLVLHAQLHPGSDPLRR